MKSQILTAIFFSIAIVHALPQHHHHSETDPTPTVPGPDAGPAYTSPGSTQTDIPPGSDPTDIPPGSDPTDVPPGPTPTDIPPSSTPSDVPPGSTPAPTPTGVPGSGTSTQSGTCPSFTMNAAVVAELQTSEGSEPGIYNDQLGQPTIGIGHKCVESGCGEVTAAGLAIPLTDTDMNTLLQQDLATGGYLDCGANLQYGNSNQRSVLADLCFNCGPNDPGVLGLIDQINNSGGVGINDIGTAVIPTIGVNGDDPASIPGIPERRQAELAIFITDTDEQC
jgi:GH24 family phage-related lysozyme (muramidase)